MEKEGEMIMSYEQLEAAMVTYSNLVTVPVKDNGEPMIIIDGSDTRRES